jgi:hypothetical protein
MLLDQSGNLGLGVTPSAWNSNRKAIQTGNASLFSAPSAASYAAVGANVFNNSGGTDTYISSAAASLYLQNAGAHAWSVAASGTAGNAISFTQAMTLDASGRLLVGTTSAYLSTFKSVVEGATSGSANFALGLFKSGTPEILNGDVLGNIYFYGVDNSVTAGNNNLGAQISCVATTDWTTDGTTSNAALVFYTHGTTSGAPPERARITSGGDLLVGTTSATAGAVFKVTGATANSISHQVWTTASSTDAAYWTEGSGTVNGVATGSNAAAAMIRVNKDSGTTRSINAAGSLNASGADYAEYMTKAGNFKIAKGDICGIDENGKLTNVFAKAISFVVKSTDPAYVGGDTWFVEAVPSDEAELPAFKERMELARQMVDRIAFAGQVPVNVIGATAGQYIVPVNDNGAIKGIAVNSPTFEQYQIALGKVIAIESDGRARIIVKVV